MTGPFHPHVAAGGHGSICGAASDGHYCRSMATRSQPPADARDVSPVSMTRLTKYLIRLHHHTTRDDATCHSLAYSVLYLAYTMSKKY